MATIGAFSVIFDDQDRVLCVKANYASLHWSTPGGRVEAGESPVETLVREVLEETGYIVEPGELIGVYAKPYRDDLVLSFRARIIGREPWSPNHEISEIGFYKVDALPDHMGVIARTRIMDGSENLRGIFRVFNTPDLED